MYPLHKIEEFVVNELLCHLDGRLKYHSLEHTLDVTRAALRIAKEEGITDEKQLALVHLAGLFHDSGFLRVYQGHETHSCDIACEILPTFGVNEDDLRIICGMIMATRIPQTPLNHLEKIICDADLDYLGRDDFYEIGQTLFDEWKSYGILTNEEEWNRMQVNFISFHRYFTPSSQQSREGAKMKRLEELRELAKF